MAFASRLSERTVQKPVSFPAKPKVGRRIAENGFFRQTAKRLSGFNWLLLAIVGAGLALRFWGINYGLPYTYGPDEPTYVTITLKMLKTGDLDPHWWYYPSLMFYLNGIAYLIYFAVGRLLGFVAYASPADLPLPEIVTIGVGHLALPAEFLIARGMTALFSAGSIVLVFAIGRRVATNKWVALIASIFLAVSWTAINLSHRYAPDIYAMFFALASVLFALLILDDPRLRNYVLAGVFAGLAIAAKYNAGLVLLALAAAHWFRYGRAGFKRNEIYIAGGATAMAFLIGTPFALFDFPNFWSGVQWQAISYTAEGHAGEEGGALAWYVGYLWQVEGPIILLAALFVASLLFRRSANRIVLVSYPLVYFVFVSTLLVRNDRTILQIIPFLDLFGAAFLVGVCEWLAHNPRLRREWIAVAAAVLVGLMVIPQAQSAFAADLQLNRPDSRESARIWIDQNLPAGARVAVEGYSPYVDTSRYAVHGEFSMIDRSPDWYLQNGYEYLVFSYGAYGRYYEEPALYSDGKARYDAMFARFPEMKRFDDGGYEIRILKTNVRGLPAERVAAQFGVYAPLLEFVGYDVNPRTPSGDESFTLCWRALVSRHDQLQLTAHLIDRNDRDEGRTTGSLFGPDYAIGNWPAQVTCIPWNIGVPDNAAGIYRIELDVDAAGMGRIPVLSRDDLPVSDKLFLAPVKIPPEPPLAGDLANALQSGAKFGKVFTLQAYRFNPAALAGDTLGLTLYWNSVAATEKDYTVFVHLLDSSGSVVAQTDAQPRSGLYPTSLWEPGQVIRDDDALALPRGLAPGDYRIEIGAYEYPNLTRLPVASADGQATGDHLILEPTVKVQ